jgi:6-phosphogluconolactonase (cycloisomerase 2 family)
MEIKQSMSKRFGWLFGLVGLVLIGFLVACGQLYNPGGTGLVIVGSQGSGLLETFSYDLNGGVNVNGISNPPESTAAAVCILKGLPFSIVLDTSGNYAYSALFLNSTCPGSQTGIQAFRINSAGEVNPTGNLVHDPNPVELVMDTTGKFLFVAEGVPLANSPISQVICPGAKTQFGICVYKVGNGTLTPVASNASFVLPPGFITPNIVAVAPSPMTLPPSVNGLQTAVCSNFGNNPPSTEYLYAVDQNNYAVWEFNVNTSSGALSNPSNIGYFVTGTTPAGVTVDPCDRFVFVSDYISNQVSAYSICNGLPTQASICPTTPDGRLIPVAGSPFALTVGNGPTQLQVDPFGNYLYVLDTLSNQITPFHISPVSGSLTALAPAQTGLQPTQFYIRGDGNWMFVANYNAENISQFSITPQTGGLNGFPAIPTDNYPWGIAVK